MTAATVIDLQGIWTRFGKNFVHRNIDLQLRQGAILGLVGASGCGKTVLMREMIGLQVPTRGRVELLGHDLARISPETERELRNRCGVLFQGGALFSALTVFDNIAFGLRELRHLDEPFIERLVAMKLSMVGLDAGTARLMPSELSGGMVKRVALARSLILEPELLFLDEPTAGLDPVVSDEFISLLQELQRDLGFTIVLITHDLDTLSDLCTHVAVMADQRLVAFGSLEDALRCTHPFAIEFFHGKRARRILGRAE